MSAPSGRRGDTGEPLDEREIAQLRHLLSDPFAIPAEFWTAVKAKLENDPPEFNSDVILGFGQAALRALPVTPVVSLAVNISGANTDLPGPGRNLNSVWMINPGGGSLRGIGEPAISEGARITLKGSWIGSTQVKNNVGGGGPSDRPILLSGGVDILITDGESLELVYVDTFWQDVAASQNVPDGTATGQLPVWNDATKKWVPGASTAKQTAFGSWTTPAVSNNTAYTTAIAFGTAFPSIPHISAILNGRSGGALDGNDLIEIAAESVTVNGFTLVFVNGPRNGGTYTITWKAEEK